MLFLKCDGVYEIDSTDGFISCNGQLSSVTESDLFMSLNESARLTAQDTSDFMAAGLQVFAIAAVFAFILRALQNR